MRYIPPLAIIEGHTELFWADGRIYERCIISGSEWETSCTCPQMEAGHAIAARYGRAHRIQWTEFAP